MRRILRYAFGKKKNSDQFVTSTSEFFGDDVLWQGLVFELLLDSGLSGMVFWRYWVWCLFFIGLAVSCVVASECLLVRTLQFCRLEEFR